ncbi:MAG: SufS family cysteine desulfurase [Candidatus ainarchaeum sp.]|nr:SufS family cysteine desulfurase [Candidatus ainarchaeum sp.]
MNGKRLVYLDSAATSQKPKQVIDAVREQYELRNANVHRGVHALAEESTLAYEEVRNKVAKFINAKPEEIIFTKNASEALNLVVRSYAAEKVGKGNKIATTIMEHHSSFVPVQVLAKQKAAKLEVLDLENGEIPEKELARLEGAKFASVIHASNVLGTINDVKRMARIVHQGGGAIMVDGSQSTPHMGIDVKEMDADFFAFTAHKMLGPMGVGVLYAKSGILESMEPFLYGGDMISEVHVGESKWAEIPAKFEAGTPNVEGVIGFGAAIDYLNNIGMGEVRKHDIRMVEYAMKKLAEIRGLRMLGPEPSKKTGIVAFTLEGVHPHDVAQALDSEGIAIRAGHHCAQPLHERLGINGSARASFYIYNGFEDVDALFSALEKTRKRFL